MQTAPQFKHVWWQWTLATAGGWAIAPVIGFLGLALRQPTPALSVMPFAGFVGVGVAQWFVIKNYLHSARGWAFSGFLPGLVTGAITATRLWAELRSTMLPVFLLGLVALGGGLLGFSQTWTLKSHISKAQRWTAMSVVAWSVGCLIAILTGVGLAMLLTVRENLDRTLWGLLIAALIGLVVMAIATGLITGTYLSGLLSSPAKEHNQE